MHSNAHIYTHIYARTLSTDTHLCTLTLCYSLTNFCFHWISAINFALLQYADNANDRVDLLFKESPSSFKGGYGHNTFCTTTKSGEPCPPSTQRYKGGDIKTRNIKCDHHGAESVSKTNLESAEKQKPPLQSRNTCYNTTQANKSSHTITRAFTRKKRNVRHYKQESELTPIGKKQLNISVTMKWLCSFQLLR